MLSFKQKFLPGIVVLLTLLNPATAMAALCDVDADNDIDHNDIMLIALARNTPAAGPDDPRDADGDGVITVLDARSCVLQCTLPRCVEPLPNNAPIANAGADQTVDAGDKVQLNGSASSDADGDPLQFSWSIANAPPGSTAQLSEVAAVMPTFVADLAGEYRIELTVNDGKVDSLPDAVIVTTIPGNAPPVADAGPDQTVLIGDTVRLNGSGSSDADLDTLTYNWILASVPAGSAAMLSDSTAVDPKFFVDLPGNYVAELIVNDGLADSSPDTVSISTANSPPVANAGPDQVVAAGEPVQLNGSGSFDADNDPLTFSWSLTTRPAGSAAALDDRTVASPWLVTDLVGTYVAQLIVNDGNVNSAADTVVIIARDDSAPTAVLDLRNAAGQLVSNGRIAFGEDFILDGIRSVDIGGSIATYEFTHLESNRLIRTQSSSVTASQLLQGATLPVGQQHFSLRVTDDSGNQSSPAQLTVLVIDDSD